MTRMIFINLPVTDLKASMAFYEAVGFTNNAQFTDETAACMVWSEAINVMLLTHDKWHDFNSRPIVDAHKSGEVMLAITQEDRDAVDAIVMAAGKNGGTSDINDKVEQDACMAAASPIPMAMSGRRCGWIWRQ